MCSTRQEMMEAVRKGKADATFVYYYMAQAFVNSDTTGTMTYKMCIRDRYDTMWEWMDGTGAIMFLSCEAPKDV